MMETKTRHDAGPPLPTFSEPSGQAHKDEQRPPPPELSKAEIEAHNHSHLPYHRSCSDRVSPQCHFRQIARGSDGLRLHGGQGAQGQECGVLHGCRCSDAEGDGDHRASQQCQPLRFDGLRTVRSRHREDTCSLSFGRRVFVGESLHFRHWIAHHARCAGGFIKAPGRTERFQQMVFPQQLPDSTWVRGDSGGPPRFPLDREAYRVGSGPLSHTTCTSPSSTDATKVRLPGLP